MRRIALVLSTTACLAFYASSAAAQQMPEGTWTGVIAPPGQQAREVTYDVTYVDGELTIEIVPPASLDMNPFEMRDEAFDGETLTFFWGEAEVTCTLINGNGGTLSGECTDGDAPGQIEMIPPADGR